MLFGTIGCYAIDLEEAISKAIKNSSKIKSQFHQYKSAEKQLKSSGLAGFLPDINLQYNFDSNFNIINNLRNSGKRLTLSQRIIDGGGTFATFSRSNHLLKAAKIRFQQSKQEVALSAVKAYVNVLQKVEILKLREHKVRVSLEHLSAMKNAFLLEKLLMLKFYLQKQNFHLLYQKELMLKVN